MSPSRRPRARSRATTDASRVVSRRPPRRARARADADAARVETRRRSLCDSRVARDATLDDARRARTARFDARVVVPRRRDRDDDAIATSARGPGFRRVRHRW